MLEDKTLREQDLLQELFLSPFKMLSVFTLSLDEIFLILVNRMKISVTMITISVQINASTIFTTTNLFTFLLPSKRIKHEVGGETTVHCVTF